MRRRLVLLAGAVLLLLVVLTSLAVGSNPLSPARVWHALVAPDGAMTGIGVTAANKILDDIQSHLITAGYPAGTVQR